MTTGTVKFYDSARGFGFISPEDGSDDVFVHISSVERSGLGYLSEGQKVEFETEPADSLGGQGPKAINLFAVED